MSVSSGLRRTLMKLRLYCLVDLEYDGISQQRQDDRSDNLRHDDVSRVKAKIKTSPQQKQKHVAGKPVSDVGTDDQSQRQLDVLGVEYVAELAIQISQIHEYQGIKSVERTEKDVHQRTAGESHQESEDFPFHEAKACGEDDQQVWHGIAQLYARKDRALEYEAEPDSQYGRDYLFNHLLPRPFFS